MVLRKIAKSYDVLDKDHNVVAHFTGYTFAKVLHYMEKTGLPYVRVCYEFESDLLPV